MPTSNDSKTNKPAMKGFCPTKRAEKAEKPIGRCPCGNPAYREFTGSPACETCIAIEEKFTYDHGKSGIKRAKSGTVDYYETDQG